MPPYDAGQFGACGRQLHDKKHTTITGGTHEAEGILEGESLPLGVLGVDGRHGNVVGRAAMPRRAEYSCSGGIILFCILMVMQNK